MALSVSAFPEPPTVDPPLDGYKNTTTYFVNTPRLRGLLFGAPSTSLSSATKSDPLFSHPPSPNSRPPFDHAINAATPSLEPPAFSSPAFGSFVASHLPPPSSKLPGCMALTPPSSHHVPAYVARETEFSRDPRCQQQHTTGAITRKRSFPFTQAVLSPLPYHSPHTATSPARIPASTTRRDAASFANSHTPSPSRIVPSERDSSQPPTSLTSHLPSPNPSAPISAADSSAPNISAGPTSPEPAPSRSPGPSISPARPTITINTNILWNTPSSSSSQQLMQQQPPSQRPPASRILIAGVTRAGNSNPQSGINLRYQSMAILDSSSSDKAPSSRMAKADILTPSSSTRYMPPPARRVRRPRTSPGPGSNMLEAIPNSWASASRPSDLRPLCPSKTQPQSPLSAIQGVRTAINNSPSPVHPGAPRLRSRSMTKRECLVDKQDSLGPRVVVGPRSRHTPTQLAQPTPKRLSLGVVMNTTKLVSASPPPTSNLGPSMSKPILTATTMMATTKVLPIRSIPASPSSSPPAHSHSLSGTRALADFNSYKPTGLPLVYSPSSRSIPPSPFLSTPPRLPPVITINSATTSSSGSFPPSGTTYSPPSSTSQPSCTGLSGERRRNEGETDPLDPCPDFSLISSDGEGFPSYQKLDAHETDASYINGIRQHRQFETHLGYAEEEGVQYDDKLLRVPISPTSTCSSGEPVVEVFVDNQYDDDFERGPSPIVYARRGGADSEEEEDVDDGDDDDDGSPGGAAIGTTTAGRERLSPHGLWHSPQSSRFAGSSTSSKYRRKRGGSKKYKQGNPSSPISYHSDDSSLFHGAHRPRRRRRSQLRSYRYIYHPPASPNQDVVNGSGGGGGGASLGVQIIESPRSPSPILYAPRRSLDLLYDDEDEDEDERECGSDVKEWLRGRSAGYLWEHEGGARRVRKRTQPSSFMYEYSTPPDVKEVEGGDGDTRERGRGSERVGKEKEREKEKERGKSRKGSRGILDELAAVAVLNVGGGKRMGATSRSRSPRSKNKEKEGQWKKWKRDRDRDARHVESSSSGEGMFLYQEVLDIASHGNEGRSERRSGSDLAGLEFAP